MPHLLSIGFGYSAQAVAAGLGAEWTVTGTVREVFHAARLGVRGIAFDGTKRSPALAAALTEATHLLISVPPNEYGDPFLEHHGSDVRRAPLRWIGYLSTIGVYGDHAGGWVDEATPPTPQNERSRRRLLAEEAWRAVARSRDVPVHILRLGGIYGPGRNQLVELAAGTQRRIAKPGQVFNRIHVEGVGGLVRAAIARPDAGPVLHGVDDEPAPPQDVVVYAAHLLGIVPPPEISVEAAGLTPMGLSFYAENKRVSNAATKASLGYTLRYATYREGLATLAAAEEGRA
jgi:nucleoside-diphosphate-sugar epimerase